MSTSTTSDHRIPAVERALQALDLLCAGGPPPGIREIAQRLGVPRSTTYRILNTLEAHGVARRDGAGCYTPGPRLLAYARAVPQGADLATLAAPVLEELAREAGATAKLSVLDGDAALVVAVAPGPGAYSVATQVGRRFPLHAGAASKVLAANLPDAARARLLRGRLARATARTITDRQALAEVLARVRAQGLATDHAEFVEGVHAMAAPVWQADGACAAAISIVHLPAEPPERLALIEAALRRAARRLSSAIGGTAPAG
jgi:DNA-binding IclR family transcriptional regulator